MTEDIHNERFTKIYLTLWGICVLVALIAFMFYTFGFRLTGNLEPVKVGSIELLSNESGVQIFFDNREKQVPLEDGAYNVEKVVPGLHSIMISKDGFWPWAKTVTVTAGARRNLFAFIFKMDGLVTKPVPVGTPEYSAALRGIAQNSVPQVKLGSKAFNVEESFSSWLSDSVPDRKFSLDKSTVLFTENNTIYVGWVSETEPMPHYFCEENPCKLKMPVTVSEEPIKSIDFYKDRRDVVIFTAGASIYAIEVDREGTQNFQPLYKGVDPYFYQTPEGVLYIKDGNSVSSASL
ncbi:MAG: carboxypeptidase-like regulatory domain-containing protein [bacterium]|nr:carboxypeptidase-like regulatory domain-containing protein [bacterium]